MQKYGLQIKYNSTHVRCLKNASDVKPCETTCSQSSFYAENQLHIHPPPSKVCLVKFDFPEDLSMCLQVSQFLRVGTLMDALLKNLNCFAS